MPPDWNGLETEIADLARRQLFFVGGAPRSGTTWLQQMLDGHPDVSCRGEGLFAKLLAAPLDQAMDQRRAALAEKNATLFRHTGGYPLPDSEDTGMLIRTAILLALRRQSDGGTHRAVGEKTPENVFFFPKLKHLFPGAKFIGIVRDPRDVLASAWHFFHKPIADEDEAAAKICFIRRALPSLEEGARQMLGLGERYKADARIVTYESLRHAPAPILAGLFRFLGVSDHDSLVDDCIVRTSFAAQSGGRLPGIARNGSFLRQGIAGDWHSTLTPEMNTMVLDQLGWMFPHFGWHASSCPASVQPDSRHDAGICAKGSIKEPIRHHAGQPLDQECPG